MKLLKFVLYLPSLIILILVIIIRPFLKLRFDLIPSERLGHFSCVIELYLCERDKEKKNKLPKQIDFFCYGSYICNSQVKKFWDRKLNILPRRFILSLKFWADLLSFGDKISIFNHKDEIKKRITFIHKDINNLIDNSITHYFFTDKETKKNKELLNKYKINYTSKVAILALRDENYFREVISKNTNHTSLNKELKNVDIDTYYKAVEFLISEGYQVVRIGKGSRKKLDFYNKNYIDLTEKEANNDSLQAYLISISELVIGCNSGLSYFSAFVFRKPCFISNHHPYGIFHIESKLLKINFKKVYSNDLERILNLSEIYDHGIFFQEEKSSYEKVNCQLIDQSSSEIVNSVKDLVYKTKNNFTKTEKEKKLEFKFQINLLNIIRKSNNPLYKKVYSEFRGNFGEKYLIQNENLYN